MVGGFLVTDRMLEMFKRRAGAEEGREGVTTGAFSLQDPDFIRVCYIVAFSLFIIGLRLLNQPEARARRGNVVAAGGHGHRGDRHAADERSATTG